MNALRQKDRLWVLVLHAAGIASLTASVRERSGFDTFVVGTMRHEALFHTAWVCGLVLGLVAACFDEVLGTRDYLLQRAVSTRQLFVAKLQGIGSVLFGWFLLPPLFAWLLFAFFDDGWQFTRVQHLGLLAAGFVPAVSAAAIGFAAASLPATWWQRLLVAAAWFLAGFPLIDALSLSRPHTNGVAGFVAGHALLAALALVVAAAAAGHRADADRPWPHRLRRWGLGSALFGAAIVWAAVVRESQLEVVRSLHRTYPVAVWHADGVSLAHRQDDESWRVVASDHQPTATVLSPDEVTATWNPDPDVPRQFEVDAPRWGEQAGRAGFAAIGSVYLAEDGTAWLRSWRDGVARVGKGEAGVPFAAGSDVAVLGDTIVVHEVATHELWRLDPVRRHFVPLAFPADDRLEQLAERGLDPSRDGDLLRELGLEPDRYGHYVEFVRGAERSYVLRGDQLVAVPGLGDRRTAAPGIVRDAEGPRDPITFRVDIDGKDGAAPFQHEFTPRTALERLIAGGAMLCSLLRPPLLQGFAHLRPAVHRPACWFDTLVQGGRRTWLVLAGFAFAGLLAWGTTRRLRRLGAPAPTILFWTTATLLLGPIAALLGVVFERARAYADRTLPAPFPAPRIVTLPAVEEPVA